MSEKFKLIPDQIIFRKKQKPPDVKPPKGNPKHIRPPQVENPVQKPHRQPNNRNNRRK